MFPRFMVRKEENDRLCPSRLEQIRVGIVTWRKPFVFNDLPPPPTCFTGGQLGSGPRHGWVGSGCPSWGTWRGLPKQAETWAGGGALGPPHSELSRFMQSVKLLGLTFPSYFG